MASTKLTQEELHERVLYPITRIRTAKAGGSGVLVYSREDKEHPGQFVNICLTCEHVVDDAISVKEEWDSLLKKNVKQDIIQEVTVEVFDYIGSNVSSANATRGTIIAYDKQHDIAAIRLLNTRQLMWVARLIPKNDIANLRLFDNLFVSGCSLLHDPFANPGMLTYLREVIEQKTYIMSSASAVFGNSGGGLFHANDGSLLGLCSRVTAIQLGFGIDVMTWMNFSTHPERMYEFITHQELQFLVDDSDDYNAALKRREKKQREARRGMLMESEDGESK